MGECNYYLKARFPTAKHAVAAIPRLSDLLGQGEAAANYWQQSRPLNASLKPGWQPPSANEFWSTLRERFPLVHAYLRDLADAPDWNNGLAGQLSCMVDPRVARKGDPSSSIVQEKDTLLIKFSGIWHGADMALLEQYLTEDLGATATGSISEEDLDYYEDDEDEDPEIPEDRVFFEAIEF